MLGIDRESEIVRQREYYVNGDVGIKALAVRFFDSEATSLQIVFMTGSKNCRFYEDQWFLVSSAPQNHLKTQL